MSANADVADDFGWALFIVEGPAQFKALALTCAGNPQFLALLNAVSPDVRLVLLAEPARDVGRFVLTLDDRSTLIVLAGSVSPAAWVSLDALIDWARRVTLNTAAAPSAELYQQAADDARLVGRTLLVQTPGEHLNAWGVATFGTQTRVDLSNESGAVGAPEGVRLN